MQDLASLILFFAAGFALSFSGAWLIVRLSHVRRRRVEPALGTVLRIRADSGMYRSQMVQPGTSVWTISAPLRRDSYVPLRTGEEIVVEAAGKRGALLFRSTIVARDPETHELMIRRPDTVHEIERREHKRWPHLCGVKVRIEGASGRILDLAQGGARIESGLRTHKGDRVRLDMPWGQTLYGWVLTSDPGEARIRFEELVELRPMRRPAAAAN